MGILISEIVPGAVAMLDSPHLYRDGRVLRANYELAADTKVRPYVCFAVDGDDCWWLAITTHPVYPSNQRRFEILPAWRCGGDYRWRTQQQFLTHPGLWLSGPRSAFARASHAEFELNWERPSVNRDGLAAISREVITRHGTAETSFAIHQGSDIPFPQEA